MSGAEQEKQRRQQDAFAFPQGPPWVAYKEAEGDMRTFKLAVMLSVGTQLPLASSGALLVAIRSLIE